MLADGEHNMPGYPGSSQAQLLYENRQAFLFQNEIVAAGTASIAYQLHRERGNFYPWGMSLELAFGGNPGTFEVDIETADVDTDAHYVTINTMTSGLNSSYVGRLELPSFWAKYVRAQVVTLTNSVAITVLLTR
jgi:hypothetical protein